MIQNEAIRCAQDQILEHQKSPAERKRLGQFPTPPRLAQGMAQETFSFYRSLHEGENHPLISGPSDTSPASEPISPLALLEPSMGSGSLISACIRQAIQDRIPSIIVNGIERDRDYYEAALHLLETLAADPSEPFIVQNTGSRGEELPEVPSIDLDGTLIHGDFLETEPFPVCDLVLANPPYTRHQELSAREKSDWIEQSWQRSGIRPSSMSGLYVYFILCTHPWLKEGALSCWLIPREFMQSGYGQALREYLLNEVHLHRIHLFDTSTSQFDGAVTTSCLVWFSKPVGSSQPEDPNPKEHPAACLQQAITNEPAGLQSPHPESIRITWGDDPEDPQQSQWILRQSLHADQKWTFSLDPSRSETSPSANLSENHSRQDKRSSNGLPSDEPDTHVLGEYFEIRRGIATGGNSFFILTPEQIARHHLKSDYLRPILPQPRQLRDTWITADALGNPCISNPLFLIDCHQTPEEIQENHPELWAYLQTGLDRPANSYLCRRRTFWYWQEQRQPPLFLFPCFSRKHSEQKTAAFKGFHPILNQSQAIGTNSWLLLYPKENLQHKIRQDPDYPRRLHQELIGLTHQDHEHSGRSYGNGLQKMEPGDLPQLPCRDLLSV